MTTSAIEVAKQLYSALEAGLSGDALGAFVHEEAVFVEYPNLITPRGATRGPKELKESSQRGAQLLAWQRYSVRDAVEHGDTAIVRLTWTAEIGRAIGQFQAGQKLTAHLAQFITCREGRISRLETFDCYEPFVQS